jgi:hypothetical protein
MAYAGNPLQAIFSRIFPSRSLGLEAPGQDAYVAPTNLNASWKKVERAIGHASQAVLEAGTGAAAIVLTAGAWIDPLAGRNMTLTIASPSGSLTVKSNGLDITVTPASGGSTASAVVAAINAQLPSGFVVASLPPGSAGGTNVSTLSKTYFTADQRHSL